MIMRIKEISHRAENLVEQGEQIKNEIQERQRMVNSARADLQMARMTLETAMEKDSEGNYKGNVSAAQNSVNAAMYRLENAQDELRRSQGELSRVNIEKRSAIDDAKRYNAVEKENLKKLEVLKNKRFGGNVNAFAADLIARMNQGEDVQAILHRSLGEEYSKESFCTGNGDDANTTGAGSKNLGAQNVISGDEESSRREALKIISRTVRKPNLPPGELFDGARGNSKAYLKKNCNVKTGRGKTYSYDDIDALMKSRGQDYVEYRHDWPDFMPFVDADLGIVQLSNMNYKRNGEEGNLTQAKEILAKSLWAKDNGFKEEDVTDAMFSASKVHYHEKLEQIMKERDIELHEDEERSAVLPIPACIHQAFKHSGIISQQKNVKAAQIYFNKKTGGRACKLYKQPDFVIRVEKNSFEKLRKNQNKEIRNIKRNLK